MKRKAEAVEDGYGCQTNGCVEAKQAATEANGVQDRFGAGLFDSTTVMMYRTRYAASEPYKHAVVSNLINDSLLRSVRTEILSNIHFTSKETDIYKIRQSGDLANLGGLDPAALQKLPSLLKLRDALYSSQFRSWISEVSGAGPFSGNKTDMAVNVYVPGCHLLCHDDVIGSRRVSYILYLTDSDKPWQASWGGALRLYSTDQKKAGDGKAYRVPQSTWSVVIPPAWNQLSFFAVQPGESFHDVEEVYHRTERDGEDDGGRFRMAISGWFHIPQEGEEGYEPGLEESLAEKSSLQQLQGKADHFDEPQMEWIEPRGANGDAKGRGKSEDDAELEEVDLEFLLRYMTPIYLTPDTVDELNELFAQESALHLTNFLNPKFATRMREALKPGAARDDEDEWKVSRPPHKHRFQYLQPHLTDAAPKSDDPLQLLLNELLPSLPFGKWLSLATGLSLKHCSVLARRFRKGLDYQLAQSYEGGQPQLEYTLCVTPTPGWGADEAEDDEEEGAENSGVQTNGHTKEPDPVDEDEDNVGGYELYMAGDGADEDEEGSDDAVAIPANIRSHTGAGNRRSARRADPAVYKAAADGDDDGILFSNPASWNTMSIVLRDKGTLKFVKYVSKAAQGDRWDLTGTFEVEDDSDGAVDAEVGDEVT